MKSAAIVTPIYRWPLLPDEEFSLRHASEFLSAYDRIFVAPVSLELSDEWLGGARVLRFAADYFEGLEGYNRLLLSAEFYRSFREYTYILIYQLDCLVFSSDLEHWCDQGWDYAGAPWFKDHGNDPAGGFTAVGNGGFSLRRIATFLDLLETRRLWRPPLELAKENGRFQGVPLVRQLYVLAKALIHALGYKNTVQYFVRNFAEYEDIFWSLYAKRFLSDFRVPSPSEALPFAFECAPRYCFEQNDRRLPFGCHGWFKLDRAFWQPYLLDSNLSNRKGEQMPEVTGRAL